jgi:hypothetical protein
VFTYLNSQEHRSGELPGKQKMGRIDFHGYLTLNLSFSQTGKEEINTCKASPKAM